MAAHVHYPADEHGEHDEHDGLSEHPPAAMMLLVLGECWLAPCPTAGRRRGVSRPLTGVCVCRPVHADGDPGHVDVPRARRDAPPPRAREVSVRA